MRKIIFTKFVAIQFILALPIFAFSQNIDRVVLDSVSHSPVPYANVRIINSYKGVVSNEIGRFSLAHSVETDTVVISSIGYKSYRGLFLQIPDTIFLIPAAVTLAGIEIIASKDSTDIILEKVIKNISKNYSKKTVFMSAFFREVTTNDTAYTRLIEAAIDIQDYGIYSKKGRARIRINELRKSNDLNNYSLLHYVFQKINAFVFGERNQIYYLYEEADFIKNTLVDKRNRKGFLEENVFTLEGTTYYDNTIVYILSFHVHYSIKTFNIKNYLFIRSDDYAVIRVEKQSPLKLIVNQQPILTHQKNALVETFQKIDGKYYPSLIHRKFLLAGIASEGQASSYANAAENYTESILMVHHVALNGKDSDRIKSKFMADRSEELYSSDTEYSEEFWKTYPMLELAPISTKIKQDLSLFKSMEEQFRDNG